MSERKLKPSNSGELREQLWIQEYDREITERDLRSLDHYPHIHRSFLELEEFIKGRINAEVLAVLERLEEQGSKADMIDALTDKEQRYLCIPLSLYEQEKQNYAKQ